MKPVLSLNLNVQPEECGCASTYTPVPASEEISYIEQLCIQIYGRKPSRIEPAQTMGRSVDYFSENEAFYALSLTVFNFALDLSNE